MNLGAKVGILGGGQLARMLLEAAYRLGLRPIVLADSAADPAAQLCPNSIYGRWDDPVTLRRFFSQVDLITYENEFVPCEVLDQASRGTQVRFTPSLRTLFELQDKIRQKEILARLGIPTSRFEVFPKGGTVSRWVRDMRDVFRDGCVFKWAQLGYDGKGTWIAPSKWDRAAEQDALRFCEEAARKGVPLFVERKVNFRRELALVASYSITGDFVAYPLVVSQQRQGICRWVTGPATSLGVSKRLETRAHAFAGKLAQAISLYGTFAIEMFETEEGDLCVNELAPRVHNTGHYTQDACATSQFENHWRAILGLPLGDVNCTPAFAMLNALGPEGVVVEEGPVPMPEVSSQAHFHWYGKKGLRPGRKLGHWNACAESPKELPAVVRRLEAHEQDWIQKLKSQGAK